MGPKRPGYRPLHAEDHQEHARGIHDAQQFLAWALSNLIEHLEQLDTGDTGPSF